MDDFLSDIGVKLDQPVRTARQRSPQSSSYDASFAAAEQKYGLPSGLLKSQAKIESAFNPNAKSDQGAIGLMQLLPETAHGLGVDPHDPVQSIDGAGRLMRQNLDQYGNLGDAISAYHGGYDQRNWGPKTRAYRAAVLGEMGQPDVGFLNDIGVQGAPATPAASSEPQAAQAPQSASPRAPMLAQAVKPTSPAVSPVTSIGGKDLYVGQRIPGLDGGTVIVSGIQQLKPGETPDPDLYQRVERNGQVLYLTKNPAPAQADYFDNPANKIPDAETLKNKLAMLALPKAEAQAAQSANPLERFAGYGLGKGVHDVLSSFDKPAVWLSQQPIGREIDQFGQMLGLPSAQEAANNNEATNRQYNQLLGHDIPATGGRITGNLLATVPAGDALAGRIAGLGPVGEFIAGKAGGSLVPRATSATIGNALQGGLASALTSGGNPDVPALDQIKSGALLGGVLGGAGSAAYNLGGAAAKNALMSPETQALANRAIADFGIKLRAGQMTNNPFLRMTDSVLNGMPLSGYAKSSANQRDAFAKAVAKTIGETDSTLTPATMARAKARIGQVFDDVAAKTNIGDRDGLLSNLGNVVHEASGVLPDSDLQPLLAQVDRIGSAFDASGKLSGESYQALTRKGTPLDRLMQSADPNLRYYAGKIREGLDDALQNSAAPEDLARLQQARLQYKNLKTVEGLAAKAGAEGDISPANLLNAVKRSYGDFAYSGGGDIGNLARIGQQFLKEPPNSGTAQRTFVQNLLTAGGLLGGGATTANLMMHDPGMAAKLGALGAAGTLGTLGLTRAAGAVLDNPVTRNMLLGSAPNQARTTLPAAGAAYAALYNRLFAQPDNSQARAAALSR